MSNDIRVTCRGADSLPIDAIVEFQGALKTITQDNLDKLKRSILRHGFTAPFFVWQSADNHLIDGHQRLKALLALRQEGYDMPLLPVVYIEADSEAHAKEKLLYITSQYGEFTREGFASFVDGLDFSMEDMRLTDGEFTSGMFEIGDIDAPELADGDRAPFQQMTFTLHDEQAEAVERAIGAAKEDGHGTSDINENSNGNALAWIAEAFIDG